MDETILNSTAPNKQAGDWSLMHRVLFRFTCLYWILYNIPQSGCASLLDSLPGDTQRLQGWLAWPLQQPSILIGLNLFHLRGEAATFHPTGSGDTALDYILILVIAVLALLGTVLWSILDRKRLQYRSFDAWLRLILSFTLATALLEYGFAKIYPGQFGPPGLYRLSETYGESSPMGLLWTFMGASRWYAMFGGFAEVIPGLLLFFRRTRTIGALLSAAVMTNIVALNFFYDVPVKIYSTHLLLLSIFLAGPDLAGLAILFFLRQQAQLRTDHVAASERRWLRRVGYGLQTAAVLMTLYSQGYGNYQPYPVADRKLTLYGIWRIDHATSTVATTPWSQVTVEHPGHLSIRLADGGFLRFDTKVDPKQRSIALSSKESGDGLLHYTVDAADPRHISASGTWKTGSVAFEMQRRNPDTFLLQTRGFHWINEYPYNR